MASLEAQQQKAVLKAPSSPPPMASAPSAGPQGFLPSSSGPAASKGAMLSSPKMPSMIGSPPPPPGHQPGM
eukprot:419896-Amphidinium_carterae.1